MTEKKNYPESIYRNRKGGMLPSYQRKGNGGWARRHAYDLGFYLGQHRERERLEASNPLAGWSNLTEAIKAGERIDWERLDGTEAKCVHPELGTLTHRLERNDSYRADKLSGWGKPGIPAGWMGAFVNAWGGDYGWSLWVKGDLPLRKLTADQLEPGTCFAARHNKGEYTQSYSYAQLVKADGQKPMVVCYSRYLTDIFATIDPKEVEVIDIYGEGTFEKPEGDA